MNKSLLVALAIMPTLLVGCKKQSTELKSIAFETPTLLFGDITTSKTVELDPKPSNIKIEFDDIKWTATLKGKDCSELNKYMTFKDAGYPAEVKGGVVINFHPEGKLKDLESEDILKITATYKEKSASIDVQYSPITPQSN